MEDMKLKMIIEEKNPTIICLTTHFQPQVERVINSIIYDQEFEGDFIDMFNHELPLVHVSEINEETKTISIALINHFRKGSIKFFCEMVTKWLVPGKLLNLHHVFAIDFFLEDEPEKLYMIQEARVQLENAKDFQLCLRNLDAIENELSLGIRSSYQANRILEIKGMSSDEKNCLIQERILKFVQRYPKLVDYDVISFMQHMLITASQGFKISHSSVQITRVIMTLYYFQKQVMSLIELDPDVRHTKLKVFRYDLSLPLGKHPVLGICIALSFIKEHEVFDEVNLIKTISTYISGVRLVEGSTFIRRSKERNMQCLYIEIEKANSYDFTDYEIKILKRMLPYSLKISVQHLMKPVFMPRNEEEVMKHLVTLSQEVAKAKDLPQVIIKYDKQSNRDVVFTVIIVRPKLPTTPSMDEVLSDYQSKIFISLERLKTVGLIRKKYPKEAAILLVKMPERRFLRSDLSLDLYKARKFVSDELKALLGNFRDYNGGMIEKQIENLEAVKKLLVDLRDDDLYLLENFYYSLSPSESASCWNCAELKEFFLFVQSHLHPIESFGRAAKWEHSAKAYYIFIHFDDVVQRDKVVEQVLSQNFSSSELLCLQLQFFETNYLGYVFKGSEEKKKLLHKSINLALFHV